jgi:threonine aldolase
MNALSVVDLRSDTVTRPTPAMRRAIAEAVVGDDVFGDDPTVIELERRCAALAGKEAALYVASGTMGNQLAVNALTSPGDQVLLESEAHIFLYEQGGIAANSGCLAHVVPGTRGRLPADALGAAIRSAEDDHVARISLICTENTHNRAGGAIVSLESLRALAADAHARGVRVHMDGARLWNASVATGVPVADWAATADTVMMCFSKALGAPVGSILVGDAVTIRKARRTRKRWGGGMRQVGILAAACLHALDHHVDRLAIDHARAKLLAAGMSVPDVTVAEPDTNIVIATLANPDNVPTVLATMQAQGVRMVAFGPGRIRAICHLDVDDAGVDRAIEAFGAAMSA